VDSHTTRVDLVGGDSGLLRRPVDAVNASWRDAIGPLIDRSYWRGWWFGFVCGAVATSCSMWLFSLFD
jgi:hypothetical protein